MQILEGETFVHDARIQLAMALVIVGAWDIERLEMAFRFNASWGILSSIQGLLQCS